MKKGILGGEGAERHYSSRTSAKRDLVKKYTFKIYLEQNISTKK